MQKRPPSNPSTGKNPSGTIECNDCQAVIQLKEAVGCPFETCVISHRPTKQSAPSSSSIRSPAIIQGGDGETIIIKQARPLCFSCVLQNHRHSNYNKNIKPLTDYASEEFVMETLAKVESHRFEMRDLFSSLVKTHPAGAFFGKVWIMALV